MVTVAHIDGKLVIQGEFLEFTVHSGKLIVNAEAGVRYTIETSEESAKPVAGVLPEAAHTDSMVEVGGEIYDVNTPNLKAHQYLAGALASLDRPASLPELSAYLSAHTAYATTSGNVQNTLRTALIRRRDLFSQSKDGRWVLIASRR